MGEPILVATSVQKTFGDVAAVRGVDLVVRAGERVGLVGPNGAGKTTTLLILLGAVRPDAGTVEILGHPLPRRRSAAMAGVGFAAGYLPMPERLRVREALGLFAGWYGVADAPPAVSAGLARFGISHLADRMCQELSSGQRTLVGVVKAILDRPRLLVLDEPTASLDPDVALRVRARLRQYCHDEGAALLVTSHDMRKVEELCERVVFIARGEVVADGTPRAITTAFGHDDLEGVFLQLAGDALAAEEVG